MAGGHATDQQGERRASGRGTEYEPHVLRFSPTRAEREAAFWTVYRDGRRQPAFWVWPVLLAILGGAALLLQAVPVGIVLLLLAVLYEPLLVRRHAQQKLARAVRADLWVTVEPGGVQVEAEGRSASLPWTDFTSRRVTPSALVIWTRGGATVAFPTSQVSDAQRQAVLDALPPPRRRGDLGG